MVLRFIQHVLKDRGASAQRNGGGGWGGLSFIRGFRDVGERLGFDLGRL